VGGDPDEFGMTVTRFHRASANRARHWPHTMLASSTHDNKRSEDVRARLDAITENPAALRLHLRRWSRMNERHRRAVDEATAPSRNDEYLIYQTLLGSLPLEARDERALAAYGERLAGFLGKALREAKVHSSWANVNEPYEAATQAFAAALLADAGFLADFRHVLEPIAWAGRLNSLAMAAVKLTSPGVPDIYQGNELLDFSLVDPDNRRPVDFDRRRVLLERVKSAELPGAGDEHAKLFVIERLLTLRSENEALFLRAGYTAVRAHGERSRHVLAYARRHEGRIVVCVVPRLTMKLGVAAGALPCGAVWGDTTLGLPFVAEGTVLRDVFSEEKRRLEGGVLRVGEVLTRFPVAVLASERPSAQEPRPA
jgi:(1->4)-alpha-D-glucan 1-alpha-D-glucosylmutase